MRDPSVTEPVVVIGASLAGTATAIELARSGIPVRLIDKGLFPRRKPCGEGLSARGRTELLKIGFDVTARGCEHNMLAGYRIITGKSRLTIAERSGITGIARANLDYHLIQYASSFPSIDIVLGKRAAIDDAENGLFKINVDGHTFHSRIVIIADGSQSPTLRALGRPPPRSPRARLGTSSAWTIQEGRLPPYVHTLMVPGGEIYLTPTSDRTLNISALGHRSLVQPMAHEETLKNRIEEIAPRLGLTLSLLSPPISCGPINSTHRGAHFRGAFVVGDACETFDPCAGLGMTHAVLSGRLAASHITRAFSSSPVATELAAYARARHQQVRDIRGFTRLTSATMSHPAGRFCLPLLVSSGLAESASDAAHSPTKHPHFRHLLSLAGTSLPHRTLAGPT